MTGFSILICAFNAKGRLGKTLEHLSALEYPAELVEIILVDNNSTDGTKEFVNDLWQVLGAPFSFRTVSEGKQGLNHARKRGIHEAWNEFIVFCDDDNWLDSRYLVHADGIVSQNRTIGVLGGQGVPVTDADHFPNWFFTYGCGYAIGVQGVKSGDISSRGFVWGAAAIARRDLLEYVFSSGGDFILSGRTGGEMSSGDDSEMCKWFLLAGYRLWYDESLIFHHFIPKERLNIDYAEKLFKGFNDSSKVLSVYEQYQHLQNVRRSYSRDLRHWIASEIVFSLNQSPHKAKVVALAESLKGYINQLPAGVYTNQDKVLELL